MKMSQTGRAYFVRHPRVYEDLTVPHLLEQERSYEVVKTVILSKLDFENFTTDMVAERQFIEDNAALCNRGEVWKCIQVRRRRGNDAVLIMPEDNCYVGWAAVKKLSENNI